MQMDGNCQCGKTRFEISGEPLFRAFCHCKVCQTYNQAAFADIIVMRATDVSCPTDQSIVFKNHTSPKLLSRGTCAHCNNPALERLDIPFFPKLIIVPVQTLGKVDSLPEPQFHMFYAFRAKDIKDGLPKYARYLASQLKFSLMLISRLMRSKTS